MAASNKKLAVLLGLVAVGSCVPTWGHIGLGGGISSNGCSSCQPPEPNMGPKGGDGGLLGHGPPGGPPPSIDKEGPDCEGGHCGGGDHYGPDKKCSSCRTPEKGRQGPDEGPPDLELPTYGPPGPRPIDAPQGGCDGAKTGSPCGKNGPHGPKEKEKRPESESPEPTGPPGKTKVVETSETTSISLGSSKTAVLPDVPLRTPSSASTGAQPTGNPKDTNPYSGDKKKVSVEVNATRVPEKQVEDGLKDLRKRPCEIRGDRFSMSEGAVMERSFAYMLVVNITMGTELKRDYSLVPCKPSQHSRVVSCFQGQYINGFVHKVDKKEKDSYRLLVEGSEMSDVVIDGTDMRREPVKDTDVEERVVVKCGSGIGSCGEPKKCQGDECRSVLELTFEAGGTAGGTVTTGSVFKPCKDGDQCQCVRACAGEKCVSQRPMPDLVAAPPPVEVSSVMTNPPLERMLDIVAERASPPQYGAPDSGAGGPPRSGPAQPDAPQSGSPRSGAPSTSSASGPAAPPRSSAIAGNGNSTRTNSTGLPRLGAAAHSRSANVMSAFAVVAASALALLL